MIAMYSKVRRSKLRDLGFALMLNMSLGLFLYFIPFGQGQLTAGATNSTFALYRYLVGLFAGILALVVSKTEKGYFPILVASIAAFIASLILTYKEHNHRIDSLVDLNLFLQGIIIYVFLQIGSSRKRWTTIINATPHTLDLHIDGRTDLFNRMIMSPHLEVNTEILRNVDYFLSIQTDYVPLTLCIHSAEPISEHLQKNAREAFQMYYQDLERKIRKFIKSRHSRSVWMIVISITAFRVMSMLAGQDRSSSFWEILSSFAAFSLWKVGDTYFEHTEAMQKLARVLIAKNAKIEFM